MIEGIAEIEARTDFAPLLDRLAEYIGEETGRAAFLVDRGVLSSIVLEARMIYDGTQTEIETASKKTLRELSNLVDRIQQLLTADANYPDIEIALKAAARRGTKIPDEDAEKRAVDWHHSIVEALDVIRREAPPPPKRGRGKPTKTKDLRILVWFLADVWEFHTGKQPEQNWRDGGPLTNAAKFVHDVVAFIDPQRLRQVPEVMEKFVADRHAGQQDRWWRNWPA